jgi:hypothetical protein
VVLYSMKTAYIPTCCSCCMSVRCRSALLAVTTTDMDPKHHPSQRCGSMVVPSAVACQAVSCRRVGVQVAHHSTTGNTGDACYILSGNRQDRSSCAGGLTPHACGQLQHKRRRAIGYVACIPSQSKQSAAQTSYNLRKITCLLLSHLVTPTLISSTLVGTGGCTPVTMADSS